MSVLAIAGLAGGLLSTAYGAWKSSKAAKEEKDVISRDKAVNQAWYDRNYYQDHLNSVQAQNAIKKYREEWEDRVKEERARQVISGGTPEQAQAVAEAGGEAMGDLIANLAAQGEQNKQAIDAQKLAMDNNISDREMALARAKQEAGANLMQNGINMATSSLQAFESPKAGGTRADAPATPATPETSSTRVNTPDVIGKEAGINPALVVPENDYYSKNKKYY